MRQALLSTLAVFLIVGSRPPASLVAQSALPWSEVLEIRTATTLEINDISSVKPGGTVTVSGQVRPTVGGMLGSFCELVVSVQGPGDLEPAETVIRADAQANYEFQLPVVRYGNIHVKVEFPGRVFPGLQASFLPSWADILIPVAPPVGMALVVAGGPVGAPLFPSVQMLADMAVTAFRRTSVSDNPGDPKQHRVWYLHPDATHDLASDADLVSDVDGAPSLQAIREALTAWAPSLVQTTDDAGIWSAEAVKHTPLTVYLIGYPGTLGGIDLNGAESIDGETLNSYLAEYEEVVKARYSAAGAVPPASLPVTVVVEAARSGDFIFPLRGPERVILTSTNTTSCGNPRPELCGVSYIASGGSISFSSYFLSRIATGNYIHPSFAYARINILSNEALVGQEPQLEATGEGVTNQIADEIRTAYMALEYRPVGNARPRLQNALGQITLRNIPQASLWVYLDDPEDELRAVNATIAPPTGSFEPTRVIQLSENPTKPSRFEGTYDQFAGEGIYTVVYTAEDQAGNVAVPLVKTVIVADTLSPEDVTGLATATLNQAIQIRWKPSASPDAQGYRVYLTVPGGSEVLVADVGNDVRFSMLPTGSGVHMFRITAYDRAPNESAGTLFSWEVNDEQPPTTSADVTPTAMDGWNNTPVTVTLTAVDNEGGSGVAQIEYQLGSGEWTTYSGPVVVTTQGETTLSYRSEDAAGNVEQAKSVTVRIDTVLPTLMLPASIVAEATNPAGAVVAFVATAEDSGSGTEPVICDPRPGSTFPLGTAQVTCSTTDAAGNTAQGGFAVTVVDTTPPTLVLPNQVVADATGPAGALVPFDVSAVDTADAAPRLTCTPASGAMMTIGSTTVSCSATDASGNVATGSFGVLVKAAAAQVEALLAMVESFNLQQGVDRSLDTKLQRAYSALQAASAGDRPTACNQLAAMINETSAQADKALTRSQADALILAARRILAVVGCS